MDDKVKNGAGANALRGFYVQTLISLMKALEDKEWDEISLEPPEEEGVERGFDLIFYKQKKRFVFGFY